MQDIYFCRFVDCNKRNVKFKCFSWIFFITPKFRNITLELEPVKKEREKNWEHNFRFHFGMPMKASHTKLTHDLIINFYKYSMNYSLLNVGYLGWCSFIVNRIWIDLKNGVKFHLGEYLKLVTQIREIVFQTLNSLMR